MENVEWKYQDGESLARINELTVNSKTVLAPFHSTTTREDATYLSVVGANRREPTIAYTGQENVKVVDVNEIKARTYG